MFTTALNIKVGDWIQPTYLSTGPWYNKWWHIYAAKYYAASEKEQDIYCMNAYLN